ncbi:MAG: tRNA epoxyqueuosine(34) reductase QueG [Phycisphaerales bacterium]|nr:tRNA epoxyqueuosine(34) reductase QueG [Phycisphaerales bacterium]
MNERVDDNQRILNRCRELGFGLAGITDAAPTQYEQEMIDWLSAGKHGEMAYLRHNLKLRLDPRELVPGAESIICVADRYFSPLPVGEGLGARAGISKSAPSHIQQGMPSPQPSPRGRGRPTAAPQLPPRGRIARYARGDDYHVVMKKRLHALCNELAKLFPNETFRACVDTAPILEREHAQRAGLGAVGKHTLLIQRGVGSYLLLGEIVTTLQLASSRPAEPDPCGSCTRCIDACPTRAITPFSVDATKCISYLTIEHRGPIDERYHHAMGDWIFGCDICQEVCPHNQPTARSRPENAPAHAAYTARRDSFDLLEILNWNEESRRAAFIKSAMKRAKLDMIKRNALIAVGNSLQPGAAAIDLHDRIEELAASNSESAIVRQTAAAVLKRLPPQKVSSVSFDPARTSPA